MSGKERYTDLELMDEMVRVMKVEGQDVSVSKFMLHSTVDIKTFTRRWGTWKKSKKEAMKHMGVKEPTVKDTVEKDVIPPDKFLSGVDIVAKVLDFMNKGVKDGYIDDDKLRKRFGISSTKWREMTKLTPFEDRSLRYERDGKQMVVWSSLRGIERAKKTISMARYE